MQKDHRLLNTWQSKIMSRFFIEKSLFTADPYCFISICINGRNKIPVIIARHAVNRNELRVGIIFMIGYIIAPHIVVLISIGITYLGIFGVKWVIDFNTFSCSVMANT